jgi:hypothetical protein
MGSEREELYGLAEHGEDHSEEKVKEKEETKETDPSAEKEEEPEVKAVPDGTETEQEKEVGIEEEKIHEKGDLKSALKEERIKRRKIRSEYETKLSEKEKQLDEVLQTLRETVSTRETTPDSIDDYETEIRKLQSKINDIDNWRKTASTKLEEDERQKSYKELMLRIDSTSSELEKEGYPGFTRFKSLISEELNKLPETERVEMDNEEGWKEIYKETVFPSIKPIFQSITKAERDANKIEEKKKMNMIGENKGDNQTKKEETWTMEDYVEWRRNKVGR